MVLQQKFSIGDSILLLATNNDKWHVILEERDFHCKLGRYNLAELVNQPSGTKITSNKGKSVVAVYPTSADWVRNIKHQSQIIYEKDAGAIVFLANALPGSTIYEAGTGSGSLTSILARAVGPSGKVITHDIRPEAKQIAEKNLAKMGLTNVEFHFQDVKSGFSSGTADAVVLDMVDPWVIISHVTKVLKAGGMLVVFQPTYNQLENLVSELSSNNFTDVKCIELLEREIELKQNAIRPSTRMIGHTGFIVSARYIGDDNAI